MEICLKREKFVPTANLAKFGLGMDKNVMFHLLDYHINDS